MNVILEFLFRAILIGAGATLVMDCWNFVLKLFGVKSLNFAFLGRWIGHLPRGKWVHENIAQTEPVKGELLLGWCAHYSIGIAFAALLLGVSGIGWARSPSLAPALFCGVVTVLAPYFILQPGLGAGIASSRTPSPNFNRVKSLVTHIVFGFGLYASALTSSLVLQ